MIELKPNPDNPRRITKENFEALKKDILAIPDGLDAHKIVHKDGIIVAGNQRYRALKELEKEGLEIQDNWFKDVTGWTDEQIKRYLITSNVNRGEWDMDMLSGWDEYELKELGVEIPSIDFDSITANKEINAEDLLGDNTTVCPKCNFEFEKK